MNVGILHTSLAGAPGHDPYAPCSVADLRATGFATGPSVTSTSDSSADGPCAIVMPGFLRAGISTRPAPSPSLWSRLPTTVRSASRSVAPASRSSSGSPSMRRHRRLARPGRDDRQSDGGGPGERGRGSSGGPAAYRWKNVAWRGVSGAIWISCGRKWSIEPPRRVPAAWRSWKSTARLRMPCRPPRRSDHGAPPACREPGGPIRRLSEAAVDIGEELRGQLPPECRHLFGADEQSFNDFVLALAQEGADDVLARLHARAKGGES